MTTYNLSNTELAPIMDPHKLREKLKNAQLSIVSRDTGISRKTLYNICNRHTDGHNYSILLTLTKYFETN